MAYTKNNWQTGDTITAEKLNNMEGGIEANDGYWVPLIKEDGKWIVPEDKRTEVDAAICSYSTKINGFSFFRVQDGNYEELGRVSAETSVDKHGQNGGSPVITSRFELGNGLSVPIGRLMLYHGHTPWYEAISVPDEFEITITPTNPDFSGATDRTQDEINDAFYYRQRVVFLLAGDAHYATEIHDANTDNTSYGATVAYYDSVVTNSWLLLRVQTNGDYAYTVDTFPLTPMS